MTAKGETLTKIWSKTREILKAETKDQNFYNNFIFPTSLYSLDGREAIVTTDTEISKRLLSSTNVSSQITRALNKVVGSDYIITYICQKDLNKKNSEISNNENKEEPVYFRNSFIRPEYTFDNFVTGNSNKEAYQAAFYIAGHQGQMNPLFIYSKAGLGKTHLLHAIGNYVRNKEPQKKVLYITSQDFVEEFVRFAQGKQESGASSMMDFFRTIDYLLIDDIQFLAGKEATSNMFFSVFNTLVGNNKQIVLTSDRPPLELKGLEERLVSRFSMGLSVSINKPEQKTMVEILKTKIKAVGSDPNMFNEDALAYIAKNNSQNVRVLEGAMNRILFYVNLKMITGKVTLKDVQDAFEDETKNHRKPGELTPEIIIDETARYYNLTEEQILSRIRTSQIALARSIAMYLTRDLLKMPYGQIGKAFGGKDHSTVMSACSKIDQKYKTDPQFASSINKLKAELKN